MEDPINQPLLNHKDEEADVDFNKEITEKIQSGFVVKVYGILLYSSSSAEFSSSYRWPFPGTRPSSSTTPPSFTSLSSPASSSPSFRAASQKFTT